MLATLVAVLACAVCPVCLTTYAKVFASLGMGFGLSEAHHHLVLTLAVGISVALSAWRSWRGRRAWPLSFALLGASLVFGGHLFFDSQAMEWLGVLTLLAGGLVEHFRLRYGARAVLGVGESF